MRILLIDDDERLIEVLKSSLTECNYVVDAVFNGEQGWTYGSTYAYDLIILETVLPDISGIHLCRHFRENGYQMPILFLTSKNTSNDKIQGLNSGADDYIIKPFDFDELNARIRTLLRRETSNLLSTLHWGELQVNTSSLEVTYNGNFVPLTAKEYTLLELFLHNERSVLDVHEIIESLWNAEEVPSAATVRSHLRGLRRKLQQAGAPHDFIETVRGHGYRLKIPLESKLSLDADFQKRNRQELGIIWDNYQQKSSKHLELLEQISEAIATGFLNAKQQEKARLTAHSLAGYLEIFGWKRAAKLAQELECFLQGDYPQLSRFSKIFKELQQEFIKYDFERKQLESHLDNSLLLLIIDDDTHFTESLKIAAKKQGIRTEIAINPRQIRPFLDPFSPGFPDAVLLKLSFLESYSQSRKNAPTLVERLSAISEIALRSPSLPIITIADRDIFSDRLEIARRGGCLFIREPATPDQTISSIFKLLQRSHTEYKVMIVDDDIDLLKAMPSLLHPYRFKLTTLDDPRQFWDVLSVIVPDLLILDLEMPYISGIELCQVLRSHLYWQHLPVILLGMNADTETQNRAFAIGIDDFVSKPIIGQQLANRILNRLKRKQ